MKNKGTITPIFIPIFTGEVTGGKISESEFFYISNFIFGSIIGILMFNPPLMLYLLFLMCETYLGYRLLLTYLGLLNKKTKMSNFNRLLAIGSGIFWIYYPYYWFMHILECRGDIYPDLFALLLGLFISFIWGMIIEFEKW